MANSCDFFFFLGEVKAKIKRSARDEMEAMADRLVFTATNGEKRTDKSDFWKQFQVIPFKQPPLPPHTAGGPWQGHLCVPAHRALNRTESERGSLPQQPSPASPPTCLVSETRSQRSRRINTAVSLKRSHRNGNTLGQLAADPFKRISRTNWPAVTFTVRDESLRILAETSERT